MNCLPFLIAMMHLNVWFRFRGRSGVSVSARGVANVSLPSSATEPFVLLDDAGAPLVLAPGTTWVELLPERGEATWQ